MASLVWIFLSGIIITEHGNGFSIAQENPTSTVQGFIQHVFPPGIRLQGYSLTGQ